MTFAWDPTSGASGYIVVYGPAPGIYTNSVDVGNQTSAVVPGLTDGQTYYFAVEAYSSSGAIGAPSDEVSGSTTNTAPQVANPGSQLSTEGATVSLSILANDAESDPPTYFATGLPNGLFIHPASGLISGTIGFDTAGAHTVTVMVNDGSLIASVTFTWTVQAVDRAPTIDGVTNRSNPVGTPVSLQIMAIDLDGDTLVYGAASLPPGLSLDANTGLITGTLTTAGLYGTSLTASDGTLTGSASFSWTVVVTNSPPTLVPPANQESSVVNPASLQLSAADVDANTLTFTASGLPPGLALNSFSGLITGTPTEPGVYVVTASVSDGLALASQILSWTIDPDRPPVVTNPGNQSSFEGQLVSLQIVASDPDGLPVFYSASLPPGLSIDSQGLITGIVPTGSTGESATVVTVSDRTQQTTATFQWTISVATPTPPVVVAETHFAVDRNTGVLNRADLSVNVTGTNTMLVVAFHSELDGGDKNWSVQDNGVPGTLIANLNGYSGGAGNQRFRVYYWLNPPQGTNTIVVQNSYVGSNELAVSAIVLNNVLQSDPLGTMVPDVSTAGRTGESETVTSTVSDLVLHVIADALYVKGNLGSGETSVSIANDGLPKSSGGDGDASLWISTKPGESASTTVSSSGWPGSPAPAPRVINSVAVVVHGAAALLAPDLIVMSTHVGAFTQGQTGATYTLTVANSGTTPTASTVTVVDTLPPGLTATAIGGPGWYCSKETLTCTRSDVLAPADSYPPITVTVTVALNAPLGTSNNVVTVSGLETDTSDDTSSDPTTILVPGVPLTPALIQSNYATPQSPQNSVNVTYAAPQSAGNLNVVAVGWNDPARHVSTITDTKGNTYTLAVGPTVRNGFGGQSIYYAKNISAAMAGTNAVTVTFDGATIFPDVRIAEYGGVDLVNPLDVTAAAHGSSTTSDSGVVTTTNATDLLIAANLVETGTIGPGSGYTSRVITSPDGDILMDRNVSTTGSYGATATVGPSGQWIMQLAAFRAAGSVSNQPPVIASRSPIAGATGTAVTLSGTYFGATQNTSTVTFNGTPVAPATWSDTSIVVPVPAGATTGDIVVTVGGLSSNGVAFTVLPTPSLTLRAPASGAVGTSVILIGTSFGGSQGTNTVTFNGTLGTPTGWTDTSIVVPVPAGATSGNVVVTVGGVASNGLSFTVLPTPTLTSRTPATGAPGAAVTLTGTNFGPTPGTSTVTFNGLAALPTAWSDTSIVVTLPAGASTGNIVVTVDGVASNGLPFVVVHPPTLATLANRTNAENDTINLSFAVGASDPDGDALTYSATGLPAPLSINPSTGVITGTLPYTSAGSYNVTITVSAGELSAVRSFTWMVTNVNRAPILAAIADQTNAENTTVSLTVLASDPDGEAVSYSAVGLPPGLTIGTSSGTIGGVLSYTSAGSHSVTVTASDGSLSASQTFTWTVTNVNGPPIVTAMGNLTTVAGTAISLQASATDPDGDAISYDATGLPLGVTIDGNTALIAGAPAATGVYNVTILATDGSSSTGASFVWTVTSDAVGRVTFVQAHSSSVMDNAASVAVSYPVAQLHGSLGVVVVGWKDSTAEVLSVADASGNVYQLAVGPTHRPEVGSQSIYYAANISVAAAGANIVTVTFTSPVSKGEVRVVEYQGIELSNVVDVTAGGLGNSGQADSEPVTTTFRNDLIFGAVWASWATTLPVDGLTARLTTASGALLEDATVSALGSYVVRATIDPPSPWIIQMIAFRDANHAPALTNPGSQVSALNSGSSLPLSASDVDGDPLTFSASGLPPGLTINTTTGVISGILSWSAAGIYSVTASVFDGLATTSATFSWAVTGATVTASSLSLNPGNQLTVSWTGIATPTATDWIGLFAAGAANNVFVTFWYTAGAASGNRVVTLPTTLSPGAYELRLFAQSSLQRLAASAPLSVASVTLTAGPESVDTGATFTATWSGIATPSGTDWIVLVRTGAADTNWLAWWYTTGVSSGSRTITLPAAATAGTYELRLFAQDSWRRLGVSNTITVLAPSLRAGPAVVASGDTVTATWSNIGAPSATDWITIAKTGAPEGGWVAWGYTTGTGSGSRGIVLPTWASPGTYELRLYSNDTWKRLAVSNTFTVPAVTLNIGPSTVAPGGTLTVSWQNVGQPAAKDWFTLNPVGAVDANWMAWTYGSGQANGSIPFVIPANLSAGLYEVRMYSNDTWKRIGISNTVTVTGSGTTVAVTPVAPAPGGELTLSWRNIAAPTATDWVGVYSAGAADADYVTRIYTSGRAMDHMLMTLPADISTGSYELRLFANNSLTRLATSNEFEVKSLGLAVSPGIVPRGGKLTFSWTGIPSPTSTDWVALTTVAVGALDANWVAWSYTTGAASGSQALTIPSNAPSGIYELRLFAHDMWQRLAVANYVYVGPTFSIAPSTVAPGGTMTMTWTGVPSPTSTDWVTLNPLNNNDHQWVAWTYTTGTASGGKTFVIPSGLSAGTYDLRLYANDTWQRLALSNVITITAPGPSVAVNPITTSSGGTLTVSWTSIAAPTATDWIGVYPIGAADNAYITRVFTSGLATGSTPLVLPGGLAAGQYELRLFSHDTLTRLAVGNSFTIP